MEYNRNNLNKKIYKSLFLIKFAQKYADVFGKNNQSSAIFRAMENGRINAFLVR